MELGQGTTSSTSRWNRALKVVSERIGDQMAARRAPGTQEMGEYETSEVSLNFLETRVKQFVTKYTSGGPSKVNIKLPALRRFKLDLKVRGGTSCFSNFQYDRTFQSVKTVYMLQSI